MTGLAEIENLLDTSTLSSFPTQTVKLVALAMEKETDEKSLMQLAGNADRFAHAYPSADANRAATLLNEAAAAMQKDDTGEYLDFLAADFAEAFLGVGIDPIAPIESVYRNVDGTLYGKTYFDVMDIFNTWGYKRPANFLEPEDHIACEFGFMDYLLSLVAKTLAQQEKALAKKQIAALIHFKHEHMDTWINKACNDIIAYETIGFFYKGLAYLSKALLFTIR